MVSAPTIVTEMIAWIRDAVRPEGATIAPQSNTASGERLAR
jgi:hypothetical protein